MTFAQQAEAFNKQHEELHKQFTTPERTMSVCDVCGVFINSTDNDQRKAVGLSPSLCFHSFHLSHVFCFVTSKKE